ncbi:hypothetical protein ACU635_53370 [[Actinomadura] parvosata]|uniref:hypothetical protein n=1 Tax=[Actinomadura] parvosata TaxID=1955412 RepID=UPI00406D231D
MADLGLLQAWDMWFQNLQVNQHTLYGWSIMALGRAGKVAAFLGGMTVVLDLVGPERLRKFGARYGDWEAFRSRRLPLVMIVLILGIYTLMFIALARRDPAWFQRHLALPATVLLVLQAVAVTIGFMPFTVRGIARALEHKRAEKAIRTAGVGLLVVGFHFDLLAS